jgi:hypothetical protein
LCVLLFFLPLIKKKHWSCCTLLCFLLL